MVGYSQEKEGVELEGLGEHPKHLMCAVEELQEDGRPLVGMIWVAQPLLKLVPKRQPLLLNQNLSTQLKE